MFHSGMLVRVLVALFHTSLVSGDCISYSLAFVSSFVILNDASFNLLIVFFVEPTMIPPKGKK